MWQTLMFDITHIDLIIAFKILVFICNQLMNRKKHCNRSQAILILYVDTKYNFSVFDHFQMSLELNFEHE